MATRDLSTFRKVSRVVPKDADQSGVLVAQAASALSGLGNQVMKQQAEAKLSENVSAAQLELNELDNDFRIKNQSDPLNKDAQRDYKERRQKVFDTYSQDINPFYRDQWRQSTRDLGYRSDVNNQTWGFKQAQVNTQNSINNSIRNNLENASASGRKYASGAEGDLNSLLNFLPARKSIENFATENLGAEVAKQTLQTYDEDYIKSFISGVAETNPVKALALIDNPIIQENAGDSATFQEFKTAVASRAQKFQAVAIEREVLGVLKTEVEAFKSGQPMSYAQVQGLSENMSEPAKKYFLAKNGFSDKLKLTDAEKLQTKGALYDKIAMLSEVEDVDTGVVENLQTSIFDAMNKDAISQKEGIELMSQLIEPTLEGREERIEDFGSGMWNPFSQDVGSPIIQDFYKDNVMIEPADGEDEVGPLSRALNATNKANLFDSYFQALRSEAARYVSPGHPNGLTMGELSKVPDRSERRQIYQRAADNALKDFKMNNQPLVLRSGIPQVAIQHLMKHPELKPQFDQMYGTGAANRILGR